MSSTFSANPGSHRIFDRVIQSNIELPELEDVKDLTPGIRFSLRSGEKSLPDGRISISSARRDNEYLLKFPGQAKFLIDTDQELITCYPKKGLPIQTLRHLLLDQVIPRVLAHQGCLILHGGAVTLSNGATVAFLGDTGWGKSTITTSFYALGAHLLTDDCLLVECTDAMATCTPAYPGVRLLADSIEAVIGAELDFSYMSQYSDKRRLNLPSDADSGITYPSRLDALFLLTDPMEASDSDDVSIEPLENIEAVLAIIRHSFSLDIKSKVSTCQRLETAAKLVSSEIPVCRMQHPHKFSMLPIVHQKVELYLSENIRGMK
jgi:hypothetical protein